MALLALPIIKVALLALPITKVAVLPVRKFIQVKAGKYYHQVIVPYPSTSSKVQSLTVRTYFEKSCQT